MRTCHFPFVAAIVLCTLYISPALATGPTLTGAAVINFTYNPNGGNPYWSFEPFPNGFTNTMSLTIPPVIDLSIEPSVIGPGTLSWSDPANWTRPALDMSGFTVGQTGSGTYSANINGGSSTLDVLVGTSSEGPSEGNQSFVRVRFSNIQPTGQPVNQNTYNVDSNYVSEKFNITIPTGAHVAQTYPFQQPTVENLSVQSGASLTTGGNFRVRHTLTNHGSIAVAGTIEGDFINDALAANGNVATVGTGILTVQGQLQNTGDLQIPGGYIKLLSATSNAGQISVSNSGTLQVDVSLSNSGSISLMGGGSLGGAGTVTNNGSLQWSDGYLSNPLVVNNSNSFTVTGSGIHRCYASLTNYGTITQSSTSTTVLDGPLTNAAGALYDITSDSGLGAGFGNGSVANAGTLRKSAGTGTSTISASFTNSGTIAVNTGSLAFSNTLTLNTTSTLQFQLSGLTPGTNFGKLDRSPYQLNLAGALAVTLGSGFSPALGNSFDLLDFGSTTGAFSSLQLPPLAAGLKWDSSALYTTGALSVAAGLPGDYDQNGAVDPRDYVIWRKYLGTIYTQADYNTWRSHYGQSGSAAALAEANAVPEPASLMLLCITALLVLHDPLKRRATF